MRLLPRSPDHHPAYSIMNNDKNEEKEEITNDNPLDEIMDEILKMFEDIAAKTNEE